MVWLGKDDRAALALGTFEAKLLDDNAINGAAPRKINKKIGMMLNFLINFDFRLMNIHS